MLTFFQSIILGLLQGVSELFPISSLGHSVLLPAIFGWQIDQGSEFFLVFLIATHLATALVLLVYFYRDWLLVIRGFFRSIFAIFAGRKSIADPYAKLAWLLIIATIPAGILGLLLQDRIRALFASPIYVAIFLILNGVMLYGAEKLRKRATQGSMLTDPDVEISKLSYWQAIMIGTSQALALLPGFSRTGASLGGGLLEGLDHEAAARFSFLLATPIILAAAILKLPELIGAPSAILGSVALGALSAAIAAFFSIRFLTRYFKTKTLTPFAFYCVLAGIVCLIILSH